MVELKRHYPSEFKIIETHPGGGQYDCLTLYNQRLGVIAMLNRYGSLVVGKPISGKSAKHVSDYYNKPITADHQVLLKQFFKLLGLKPRKPIPPSTPEVLIYRLIPEILSLGAYGKNFWECRNGFCDSSGGWGGVMQKYFAKFSTAKQRLQVKEPEDVNNTPAYRFWFILKSVERKTPFPSVPAKRFDPETASARTFWLDRPDSVHCEYEGRESTMVNKADKELTRCVIRPPWSNFGWPERLASELCSGSILNLTISLEKVNVRKLRHFQDSLIGRNCSQISPAPHLCDMVGPEGSINF